MKTIKNARKMHGQMGPIFIAIAVIVGLVLGALAVEFSHLSAVRTSLHNATDAAALAGAQNLWFEIDKCESDALNVAALNRADGRSVSNSSPGVDVIVTVTAPQGNTRGKVRVDASMQVAHWIAPFFDHWTDTVSVSSVAGTAGRLWRLGQGQSFPIAASIDAIPLDHKGNVLGLPLNQCRPGDAYTLYIGSQSVKNAAFTTLTDKPASASKLKGMIAMILDQEPKRPRVIPSVAIGDMIDLNNGIDSLKSLGKSPLEEALLAEPFIVLPIFSGSPPYNHDVEVIGFTGFKVDKVEIDEGGGVTLALQGTLTNAPQVTGESGPIPLTGNPINDEAISRLELGPIQLIRN